MFLAGKALRRTCWGIGLAAALSVCFSAQGYSQQAKSLDKVTVALPFPIATYLVPNLGKKLGIFEKHGIDLEVKYIRPGPLEAAIFSGSVNFAMVPAPVNHDMTLAGTGVTAIMTYIKLYQVKLMAQKDVASVKDLRGKIVSLTNASTGMSRFLMLEALEDAGLDPEKDVQLRLIASQPDTMSALLSGQVSASILGPPFWMIAEAKGAKTLVDFTKMQDRYWGTATVIALKPYLEKNPDVAVRFVRGMIESIDAWKKNPDAVKTILKEEAKMEDPALLQRMYEDTADSMSTGKDTTPADRENQAALDVLANARKSDPTVRSVEGKKPSDFYDASFVEKALAK